MKNKKQKFCEPSVCDNCIYIGEGDFYCEKLKKFVVLDWKPTDEYFGCEHKEET